MSSNQSRLGRTESQQYRNSGRSNRNYTGGRGSKASGTGSGVGATAAAPSSVNSNSSSTNKPALSSNRSFKKHNNVQRGQQPRGGAASGVALNSNSGTGQRPLQHGADLQQPSHGTSDPPVRNAAVNPAAVKPSDVASPKASRAPRAPPSIVSADNNDYKPPTTPVAPAKAPADASFSLQFGSISPRYMNGMQVSFLSPGAPVHDKEVVLASSQTSPIENLKGEDESVHHNGAGVATSLSSDVKEKSSQESHVVKSPVPEKKWKKKRKELLKNIDNNAPTSDLYLASSQTSPIENLKGEDDSVHHNGVGAATSLSADVKEKSSQESHVVKSPVPEKKGKKKRKELLKNIDNNAPTSDLYLASSQTSPIENLKGESESVHHNNADSDRWLRGTSFQKGLMPSPQTPLQMMHKTDNKYEVGKVSDEEQAKQRQLKAILKKLTPQNFEKLFEQVKQVNIDNVVTLCGVVSQIFDKALMEPTFCEVYANFCYHLSQELPDLSVDNQKITFKRLLLNKCQEEFERGGREQEEANKADDEGTVNQTEAEREEKRLKARRRMLGNIRLIGELYKKKMLTERIMHECIKKLLGQYQNPDEEDVEALCELMSTIGEMIDHPKAKEHMDVYFDMMSKLSNNMKLSSRVRFMLKDSIDLRRNKWQQRRKVEPEDWEDAAEIPTPKLEASQSGNQLLGSGEDAIGVTKKYSRDFLLIFAEQCTALPEGFEFAPNIAEALMASNVNFSHESYSNTGRNIDRPNAASRLDRRGSGIGDDVKWNKFPGQLMTGWDMRVDNTHGPNVLVGQHGAYIIDPARHFKGQWNYKGESAKITAFLKHLSAVSVPGGIDFQDRFKKSIFKDFVTAHKDRKFSGVLMRYLGFNMILPDRPDELHFRFENPGETFVFGRREFAMISGLKFGVIDEDVGSTSMCFGTGCYLEKYQNGAITIKHLERALGHPVGDGHHNGEVVYRLGLVYFIYGYLLGWNDNLGIPKHVFYLVEDLERVEDFAWGEYLWLITYEKIARLMVIVKHFSQQPEDKNNHKLAVEGWAPGFLYWAYELFPCLQQSNPPFCNRISHDAIPRMLRWDLVNSTPCGPTMGNKVMPEVEMNKGMLVENGEVVLLRRLGLSEEQISPLPRVFPKPPQKPPKELPPRPEAPAARGKHKADDSSQIATTAGTSRSNVHRVDHNDTPSTHRHGSTSGRNVLRDEGLDIDGDEEDRDVLRDEGFNIDSEVQDHHDPVHAPMQHRTSVVDGGNVVRGDPVIDAVAKMIDAATKKIQEGIDATKKKIEEEFATIRSRLDAHDLLLKNQTAILNHFYIQERNKHGPSGDGSGPSGGGGNNTGTGAHQGSTQHGARNFTQSTSTPAPKSSQPHAPHPSYTTHTASCHSVPHTTESVGLTTPVPIRSAGEVAFEGSSYLSLSPSDYLVTESEAELQAMGVVLPEDPSNIPSSSNRVSNVIGRKTNSKVNKHKQVVERKWALVRLRRHLQS